MLSKSVRKSVRVSSEMAKGEALPTLTKTKGFRALLLLAESNRREVLPGDIYEFPIATLRELLRCNDDAHLMVELEGLAGMKVNWSRLDPKSGGYSIPVSSCTWNKEAGQVVFAFDPQFVRKWQDNHIGFRRINWEVLVSFRSLYAAKIYEYVALAHQAQKVMPTKRQTIDELRELLGIPATAYQGNGGRLFQEIAKAVQQINDAQDGFRVAYCRHGRGKNAWHWFEVEDGPKQDLLPLSGASVISTGQTRRVRIEQALASLTEERRNEIQESMATQDGFLGPPGNDTDLKVYAARLRNYGVEI